MSKPSEFRRPESVLVVVHTTARECLLLRRVAPADFWQSVTGTLGWDETAAEAAAREVREETGLAPTGLRDSGHSETFPITRMDARRMSGTFSRMRSKMMIVSYIE